MISTSDIIKIGNILKDAGKIDEYRTILELQEKLFLFQEENIKLKKENNELKEKLDLKLKMNFDNKYNYFLIEGDINPKCGVCWQINNKVINLFFNNRYLDYTCPVCRELYNPNPLRNKAYVPGI